MFVHAILVIEIQISKVILGCSDPVNIEFRVDVRDWDFGHLEDETPSIIVGY